MPQEWRSGSLERHESRERTDEESSWGSHFPTCTTDASPFDRSVLWLFVFSSFFHPGSSAGRPFLFSESLAASSSWISDRPPRVSNGGKAPCRFRSTCSFGPISLENAFRSPHSLSRCVLRRGVLEERGSCLRSLSSSSIEEDTSLKSGHDRVECSSSLRTLPSPCWSDQGREGEERTVFWGSTDSCSPVFACVECVAERSVDRFHRHLDNSDLIFRLEEEVFSLLWDGSRTCGKPVGLTEGRAPLVEPLKEDVVPEFAGREP
mmetsp:Transcript_6434/g.15872  ORF Transcript_6434/g.15872 Transcript_6434/m.15872 type:complete len:263 (+) Transcript_6434:1753-2541(+)